MSEQDLYQAIVTDYEKTQSIKQTAENLKTNTIKVRRVLITEGLWSSKTSIAVASYMQKGIAHPKLLRNYSYRKRTFSHICLTQKVHMAAVVKMMMRNEPPNIAIEKEWPDKALRI